MRYIKMTTEWVVRCDRYVTVPVVSDLIRSWVWSSQALYLSSTRLNPEKTAHASRFEWTHWSQNWPRNSKQCKFWDISINEQRTEHHAWPKQLLIAFSLEMCDIFVTFTNKKLLVVTQKPLSPGIVTTRTVAFREISWGVLRYSQ